jgi:hypothetical protein
LSAWGKTAGKAGETEQMGGVKGLAARMDAKAEDGRLHKTKVHLLAAGSMTKQMGWVDVIDSVDSAAWGRAPGFGKLIFMEQAELHDITIPVLRLYDHPGVLTPKRAMTPEVKAAFKAFMATRFKSLPPLGERRKIEYFCVDQISKYVAALNAFDPAVLVAAKKAAVEAKKKSAESSPTTFILPTPWDAWDLGPGLDDSSPDVSVEKSILADITPATLADIELPDLEVLHRRLGHVFASGAPIDPELQVRKSMLVRRELVRRTAMPEPLRELDDAVRVEAAALGIDESLARTSLGLFKAAKKPMVVQSLIFSKQEFSTAAEATKWAKDNDFKAEKVDETDGSFRLRQADPKAFVEGSMRTIKLDVGVKAVVGQLEGETKARLKKAATPLQELVFTKLLGVDEEADFHCFCSEQGVDVHKADDTLLNEVFAEWLSATAVDVKLCAIEKKAGEEKRIVFGIVLEPGETDAHKDTVSEEEIEVAAHRWLAKYQNRGLQHSKLANHQTEIYESFIAPADMTIGGQKVKKGSWLLMLHILDKKLWDDIKAGKFTGFSMGGFARRTRLKAA